MRELYRVETWSFMNDRDQKLKAYVYEPPNPKAAVVFHHGYSEYCGWHKRTFTMLAESGFLVMSYDMHGHGLSQPLHSDGRVRIESSTHMLADLHLFLFTIIQPLLCKHAPPGGPRPRLYAFGHSLGGGLLSLTEDRFPGFFDGLALNAPALGKGLSTIDTASLSVAGFLTRFNGLRGLRLVPGVPWPDLCDEGDVIEKVYADPLYGNGDVRLITACSIAEVFLQLNTSGDRVACPIYVQWPTGDVLTCRASARDFLSRCSAKDQTWQEFGDGALHAMMHGARGPMLINEVITWIQRRL